MLPPQRTLSESPEAGRLSVLVLADALDGGDVGEVFSAFKWVEALSNIANLTVLATARDGISLQQQLPKAEVITWAEPKMLYRRFDRVNAMIKPWFPVFGWQIRRWLRGQIAQGRRFDIAHQIVPQAMRHSCPMRHFNIPYIIGPLGGGLQTPPGFKESVHERGIARLRVFDRFRLRHDPTLRASFDRAALLLGVAPYVAQIFKEAGLGHIPFKAVLERGHGPLPSVPVRQSKEGQLRLLHVGRTIRTKGLRDVIRALSQVRDLPGVTLVSAGDGPDLEACRQEAQALGVLDRVTFLGRITRAKVDEEYAKADVFCFPSFREPMGGVFFEAMEYGLPVIATAYGGPEFIVDTTCSLLLPATNPETLARDIAGAIRQLALDPARRLALGLGARARIISFGSWEDKAHQTLGLYHEILGPKITAQTSAGS